MEKILHSLESFWRYVELSFIHLCKKKCKGFAGLSLLPSDCSLIREAASASSELLASSWFFCACASWLLLCRFPVINCFWILFFPRWIYRQSLYRNLAICRISCLFIRAVQSSAWKAFLEYLGVESEISELQTILWGRCQGERLPKIKFSRF